MTLCDTHMSKKLRNYPGACLTVYYQLLILPGNFKYVFLTHSLHVYCY